MNKVKTLEEIYRILKQHLKSEEYGTIHESDSLLRGSLIHLFINGPSDISGDQITDLYLARIDDEITDSESEKLNEITNIWDEWVYCRKMLNK